MKFILPLLLSCSFLADSLLLPATATSSQPSLFAFTNVNVIPMNSEALLKNYTVIVRDDKIITVSPSSETEISSATQVIDGSDKYLLPGLAEMHGHIPPSKRTANMPAYFDDYYVKSTLFLYLSAGITTVRGMLGYPGQLELKKRINNGELIGPNLYLAGPSFNGNTVSSPDQAKERVIQQQKEGWDLLKIHPGLTLAEYNAIAETAHSAGITFGGHVPQDVGIVHAIKSGQKTIDHIDGYVSYLETFEGPEQQTKLDEIVRLTKKHDVWIVPTQALWKTIIGAADYETLQEYEELKYIPEAVLNNYINYVDNLENSAYYDPVNAQGHADLRQHILSEMNKAGVKILMGTDAPQLFSVPGFSIHRELPLMEEAGMTPYQIIESGTRRVGEYFSSRDNFGTITVGERADLILINHNPLEDISHIKNHEGVMVQGRWFSRKIINKKLNEIKSYYNE
ncbi:MAG: amidohydrolase family protein [Balneolaceae bacterium]|nr:amidohydrolase family protein [Balneolaceae bacterium]